MFSSFDIADAVPSLADRVGDHVPDLNVASGKLLSIWLPALPAPPAGWMIAQVATVPTPTRLVLCRNVSGSTWNGCGVLNLFTFTGPVPTDVIETDICSTLRSVGAESLRSRPLAMPSRHGLRVTAGSAAGEFALGGQRLRSQYTAYLIQRTSAKLDDQISDNRGALVEHNLFTAAGADTRAYRDLIDMDGAVYTALKQAVS